MQYENFRQGIEVGKKTLHARVGGDITAMIRKNEAHAY
jgi:hypothetical protein